MTQISFEDTCTELGQRLRRIRHSRHLSQERASQLAGIDRVTIGYYEQNRRVPRLSTLWKLANVYEVELREFFDFEPRGEAPGPSQESPAAEGPLQEPPAAEGPSQKPRAAETESLVPNAQDVAPNGGNAVSDSQDAIVTNADSRS